MKLLLFILGIQMIYCGAIAKKYYSPVDEFTEGVLALIAIGGSSICVSVLFLHLCEFMPWMRAVRSWYCFHFRRFFGFREFFKERWSAERYNKSTRCQRELEHFRMEWSLLVLGMTNFVFLAAITLFYVLVSLTFPAIGVDIWSVPSAAPK